MCPVTGPVTLARFKPSHGIHLNIVSPSPQPAPTAPVNPTATSANATTTTITTTTTTVVNNSISPSSNALPNNHCCVVMTTTPSWSLLKNSSGKHALTFGGRYAVEKDNMLRIIYTTSDSYMWQFEDSPKNESKWYIVYCEKKDKETTKKMAWYAEQSPDGTDVHVILKEYKSGDSDEAFRFVFTNVHQADQTEAQETKPSKNN